MVSSTFFDEEVDDISFKNERKAIGETTESRIKGLQYLKMRLLKIEHLRPRLDDDFLLRFLRVSKFDSQRAFERVQKFYSVRRKYSNIFKDFYPSAQETSLRTHHLLVSPHRAQDHSIVLVNKRGLYDPSTMIYDHIFLIDCLVLECVMDNPITQVCGVNVIIDMKGYSFQHFIQDTPGRVRLALETFQNTIPLRYKSIFIVNAPQIFTIIYNLCYPFLSAKIKKRIHLCYGSDWKNLHSVLPPEILPAEYGGMIPHSNLIDLTEEVIKWEPYFKEQLQYGFSNGM